MPNENSNSSSKKKSSGGNSAPKKSTTRNNHYSKTTSHSKASSKKTVSQQETIPATVETIKEQETSVNETTSHTAESMQAPMESVKTSTKKSFDMSKIADCCKNNKKMLSIAAAVIAVFVVAGIAFFFMGSADRKVLATYTNNEGKVETVRIGDIMDVLRPNLPQVPQEAIDSLDSIEAIRQVVQNVSIQPRFIVLEALNISNFQDSDDYATLLKTSLKTASFRNMNTKSAQNIYKDISNQQLMVATASRILMSRSPNPSEDEATLARLSEILENVKTSENPLQDFRSFAASDSQDFMTRGMNGYMGYVLKGSYPDLDDVLFQKKAGEGLYNEIITNPEFYQIVYVETPAKAGKLKDFPDIQNGQAFQTYVVNYIISNAQVLYNYNPENLTYSSDKGQEVDPETFTDSTVVARFWKKNYTIAQISEFILASAPPGAVAPQPAEVVQLLSDTNSEAGYIVQLGVLLRSYNPNQARNKETIELSNMTVQQIDTESSYPIIEEYLLARIDTNVTAAEVKDYYDNLAEKPISTYRDDGTPVYAKLDEIRAQVENAIQGSRMQAEFLVLMGKAAEERSLKWKDANLPVLTQVIIKEHQKVTAQK
ncbi:MAG: peptidylprolyl isomerase [Brevinema sp.]